MTRQFISEGEGLPRWTSPISHAVVVNNICYISGQLAVNEAGQYMPGTAREEAERSFANFFAAVAAAGFARSDVVFVDIAFIDLADVTEVNALFGEYFPAGQRPARTIYQAAALPFGGKVKIMGVAIKETA
ncbi:MAG: RidA family protein [Pegethrix bostrychoides GSE-TBD4-15B]|jgi:2-iminobutanoate/2-iminopropanoate deaminase|uniref:RidA family protein n=1 Tax=Pegethrix bostrychoides GSE-TBD4-15B TaxID=2839662 RepID=A0A951PCS4_9CYAN|nr:RidA family protein [Pegethrix bostrychoides GSE-TBD4-15B]